jgi:phage baseplate assembly protein W
MNTPLYCAWRFIHPVLDAPEEHAGLRSTPTGGIEMVDGNASVRQAILLLLATSRGERVMRPEYGCDLHRLVFSPNDETTAGLAIHYVRQALERWEPRIEILRLDAGRNLRPSSSADDRPGSAPPLTDDQAVLHILLEYRVLATQRAETWLFSMDLTGERA